MKIIGAGFGRCGTASTKDALDHLGFHCYHMKEVFSNNHAKLWQDVMDGHPNWDEIFQGYEATVDWPGCTFYKELMEKYPDAKVILNVRDGEKCNTEYPFWLRGPFETIQMIQRLVWRGTFKGEFESNKKASIEIFYNHIEEVKKLVPSHKLLIFKVEDGWEPLCKFLNVAVPNIAFPHVNDSKQFKIMIRRRQKTILAGNIAIGLAAVVCVGFLVRKLRLF